MSITVTMDDEWEKEKAVRDRIGEVVRQRRALEAQDVRVGLPSDSEIARAQVTQNVPTVACPVLYYDEEISEVILGGEDSPRADAQRAELEEKCRERLKRDKPLP